MKSKVIQFRQRGGHAEAAEPVIVFSVGDCRLALNGTQLIDVSRKPAEVIPIQMRRQPKRDNAEPRPE
jgi:hypothetical protein